MSILRTSLAVVASSLLLLACDVQLDPSYRGEPLASIKGTIVAAGQVTTQNLHTAIVNYNFQVNDYSHIDSAPVVGSFPARFQLDLSVPPPAADLNDFTEGGTRPSETRFSTGYIAVLHDGLDVNKDPGAVAGLAEDYLLVYVERDVQPGTKSERFLGGALKAGYHLMKHRPMTSAELAEVSACKQSSPDPSKCGDATDHLVPNPDEFSSDVTITVAPLDQIHGGNIF